MFRLFRFLSLLLILLLAIARQSTATQQSLMEPSPITFGGTLVGVPTPSPVGTGESRNRAQEPRDALQGYVVTIPAMGVRFRISFFCANDDLAAQVEAESKRMLAGLEQVFTDYDETSEAMRLCHLPEHARFPASLTFLRLLKTSEETRDRTEGCFDVSIGQFTQIWRKLRHQRDPEQKAALVSQWEQLREQRLATSDESRFEIDLENQIFQRGTVDFGFDFGGIAKGYAADRLLEELEVQFDIRHAMVDASGDVTANQPPPGSTGWPVGLSQLDPDNGLLHTINLNDYSVASSGDARQFLQDNQERKSHLLDPRTMAAVPGNHLTIVAHPSGAVADALASALSVCPDDRFQVILDRFPKAEAIRLRITESGQRHQQMSRGWEAWLAEHEQ